MCGFAVGEAFAYRSKNKNIQAEGAVRLHLFPVTLANLTLKCHQSSHLFFFSC